ncbi:hypothetical protein CPB83DRAFT_915462 [Crepidotus variabilis]|uniref:Uncharacterized protein n=1 Tax=Crepidotus variabilis TaxID=179855 RepID=A0A9P6E5P2_9AGAR|nr:hypothetical protein CPB83DRAFT_915462 [Crepidotus variabilis]
MVHSIGEFLPGRHQDLLWCDDGISDAEANILCGTVHQYEGGNCIILSWWPTELVWQSCVAQTHWTEVAERLYNERVTELQQEDAKPLSASKWRRRIRTPSTARNANQAALKFSGNVLKPHLH